MNGIVLEDLSHVSMLKIVFPGIGILVIGKTVVIHIFIMAILILVR